jgi:hypothetical protein
MDVALKDNLEASRQVKKQGVVVKRQSEDVQQVSFSSYFPPFLVALLKDILDFTLIGSLPGLGSVVTFCFSILIFLLMMMSGSKSKYSLTKKGITLMIGTVAEGFLFGLNFLPIETITVLFIYRQDKNASNSKSTLVA